MNLFNSVISEERYNELRIMKMNANYNTGNGWIYMAGIAGIIFVYYSYELVKMFQVSLGSSLLSVLMSLACLILAIGLARSNSKRKQIESKARVNFNLKSQAELALQTLINLFNQELEDASKNKLDLTNSADTILRDAEKNIEFSRFKFINNLSSLLREDLNSSVIENVDWFNDRYLSN